MGLDGFEPSSPWTHPGNQEFAGGKRKQAGSGGESMRAYKGRGLKKGEDFRPLVDYWQTVTVIVPQDLTHHGDGRH